MAFAGDDIATNKMHETLKLLHETIQKQTEATDKQSNVMIWLTVGLFALAFVQTFLLIFQVYSGFFM